MTGAQADENDRILPAKMVDSAEEGSFLVALIYYVPAFMSALGSHRPPAGFQARYQRAGHRNRLNAFRCENGDVFHGKTYKWLLLFP